MSSYEREKERFSESRDGRYRSALAQEMGVQLALGSAEGWVGCALVHVLLAVPAGGTLHDVNRLEVEVAAVWIGGIVRQAKPLKEVHTTEGAILASALAAGEGLGMLWHTHLCEKPLALLAFRSPWEKRGRE